MVKLCRDCKYGSSYEYSRCQHPKNMVTNLVTGKQSTRFYSNTLRECDYSDTCGKAARWFESKYVYAEFTEVKTGLPVPYKGKSTGNFIDTIVNFFKRR